MTSHTSIIYSFSAVSCPSLLILDGITAHRSLGVAVAYHELVANS
jgi:hypothetical protein